MEWLILIILFLILALIAGAISDVIGAIMRCMDESDK